MARKRNKKKQPASVQFPAKWAAFLVLAALLSLSYLWLSGRCENLGVEIKSLERDLQEVKVRVQSEQYKWSNLTSPERFEVILQSHGLIMSWPEESRVVRIPLTMLQGLAQEGLPSNQYALRDFGTRND